MNSPQRRRDAENTEERKTSAEEAEVTAAPAAVVVPRENQVTDAVIGSAIEVHRHLGPGLLESAYEQCLCHELTLKKYRFARQVALPVTYKGIKLDCGYKMDLVVEDLVIVEIKTVEEILPVHTAQLLTYLKLANKPVGLLINFNAPMLKQGLKRLVNRFVQAAEGASA